MTGAADPPAGIQSAFGRLLESLGPVFTETSLWAWLVLFALIVLGLFATRMLRKLLDSVSTRLELRGWHVRAVLVKSLRGPAMLAIMTGAIAIGLFGLKLDATLTDVVQRAIALFYITAAGWWLLNLVDLVDVGFERLAARTGHPIDQMVVSLLRKALRVFLLIVIALFVVQNVFGQSITSWLAGLGIAGLAVSLAAQDSLKNVFGSLTVLVDRPFSIGDRIVLDKIDGTVEEIGFRSTKVRTLQGHLINVPNMKFTDGVIENMTRRLFFQRTINATVTYDTTPEKLKEGIEIIRRILNDPEFSSAMNLKDRPPRVNFSEFNSDSLNIRAMYWFVVAPDRDYWAFQAHASKINQRILEEFNRAGIEFAFPTQTLYLAGDSKRELRIGRAGMPAKRQSSAVSEPVSEPPIASGQPAERLIDDGDFAPTTSDDDGGK